VLVAAALIALPAPRFAQQPSVQFTGDLPVDARGSFMAAVAAGPAYRLLGKRDTAGNYLTDPMPPVGQLIGGEPAWRRHHGGHGVAENWPAFVEWASQFVKGTPRTDRNSRIAHAELVEKARKGRIDVYFVGDSITRRWGTSDPQYKDFLANWTRNFYGWNAANFGWGGDRVENIVWRLNNGELDGVDPKVIVVMAGTNDVGSASPQAETITRGIEAVLDLCRRKAPSATIVLMGITPRNDNMELMPIITRVNERLARLADGKRIRFVDINAKLADANGRLYEGMAEPDGLHLALRGYQVWADALRPILVEVLGPPAREDLAPPPTGDPSLRR
jgi:lysophospholipase L1-like esterase